MRPGRTGQSQTFLSHSPHARILAVNPWFIAAPAAIAAAAGLTAYGATHPRAQLFGKTIRRTNSARKLALTFDDGPNPSVTPKLLDLLDRYKASATFFVIGRYARECPDLLREISARGHSVGNHTESHRNLFWRGQTDIRVELRLCHKAIGSILGTPPKWFRPPWGYRNPWVERETRELNMRVVMWTLMPGDWRAPSDDWLIRRIQPITYRTEKAWQGKNSGSNGDILCLHDGDHRRQEADRSHTVAALEYWLPRWRDLGLQFVTIDNAVSAPAA
jgi:peptidoglycan-N-acetylglucosamine deacetylase